MLMQNWEGQTKNFMVFSKMAYGMAKSYITVTIRASLKRFLFLYGICFELESQFEVKAFTVTVPAVVREGLFLGKSLSPD